MNLTVTARVAARDLDLALEVGAGETLALLGANGSGKSTLLSVVAGLLRPDSGRVGVGDRVLADGRTWLPPHERRVALLAQDPLLFPHLSALGNVAFGPRAQGRSKAEAHALARGWLDRLGVGHLADRRPGALSGGQAQRVALARALATDPDVLLLDEPMAALDVAVTPALRETLREALTGRTCVVATHDVLDAVLLADRVAVLESGRVAEQGPTAEVLGRPRSAFGARIAGLNLLRGTWHGDELVATTGERVHGHHGGDAAPPEGEGAVAVFRPSAVALFPAHVPGSPRNAWPVEVTTVEPYGDVVRVRAGHLAADVTPAAARELDVRVGSRLWFSVKATEVDVYRA